MVKTRKELLKKIQEKKDESIKKSISFRFKEKTLEDFKSICEKENVTMTEILEFYMKEFIKGK